MENYAIDTAARFGEIPFVEFTKELVTGVFDSLVEAHVLQMEEYANFVNSLTQDLSTYINNTQDGVSFDDISNFIQNYDLPQVNNSDLVAILEKLQAPSNDQIPVPTTENPATTETWWGGLINGLAPAVTNLVDKIKDPSEIAGLEALDNYNNNVLNAAGEVEVPTYKQIYNAIGALIASNKYSLLQNIAQQGAMRLVVTEGEVETKITFSTWNNTTRGYSRDNSVKNKVKVKDKDKRGLFGRIFKGRDKTKTKTRTLTVNTAKSYQRDSSGTKVDIFGRVLIRFKTDYAPLNG